MAEILLSINLNKSVNELYPEVCVSWREQKVSLDKDGPVCDHCGKLDEEHGIDTRCQVNGHLQDTKFVSDRQRFFAKTEQALELLEKLMALR